MPHITPRPFHITKSHVSLNQQQWGGTGHKQHPPQGAYLKRKYTREHQEEEGEDVRSLVLLNQNFDWFVKLPAKLIRACKAKNPP